MLMCMYYMYIFERKSKTSGLIDGLTHVPNAMIFDLSGVPKVPSPLFTYVTYNLLYTCCW